MSHLDPPPGWLRHLGGHGPKTACPVGPTHYRARSPTFSHVAASCSSSTFEGAPDSAGPEGHCLQQAGQPSLDGAPASRARSARLVVPRATCIRSAHAAPAPSGF